MSLWSLQIEHCTIDFIVYSALKQSDCCNQMIRTLTIHLLCKMAKIWCTKMRPLWLLREKRSTQKRPQ